jgi:integrase/recombinase XerC
LQIGEARARYIRWLRATKNLSHHTIRAYNGDLLSLERHLDPPADVAKLDQASVIAFMETQRANGLSAASLKRRASSLRGFCRWLTRQELLSADPWTDTDLALGGPRRLPRILPAHELDRLIRSLKLTARIERRGEPDPGLIAERPHESTTLLAVALMVSTGVRVHEVAGIRCHGVDLHNRAIRLLGKGERERQVFLINDWITELTSAYLETRSTLGLEHSHLLFNLHHDPLTPPTIRSRLAKAAAAAGLASRITPHMLRHTAATQLIEAGVDIRYIQRLLGHASLTTTEIYTHVSDLALRRVVSNADVLGRLEQVR